MKNSWSLGIAVGLVLMIGCTERNDEGGGGDPVQTLTGEAFYRERILLPPGSELRVTLEDVSEMDGSSTAIASFTRVLTGAPPYAFTLEYSAADIDARTQYSLRATIKAEGSILFTSTERWDSLRSPAVANVIELSMVGAAKARPQAEPTSEVDTGLAVVSVNALADLSNTYWKLVSLNEQAVVMTEGQEREAFLQLSGHDESVKGFAGCNRFTGSYTVNGNDLSFGPLAATRKACSAGMETENELLQVLDGTAYFSIHEETLTLLNEHKRPVARLVAVYFD